MVKGHTNTRFVCLSKDHSLNPLIVLTQAAFLASLGAFLASLVGHLPSTVVYLKVRMFYL